MNSFLRCFSWPFTVFPLLIFQWICGFATYASRVYDNFVYTEFPGWLDCIIIFGRLRLMEWHMYFTIQIDYLLRLSCPIGRSEKYLKHFDGTIEAYPADFCILSEFMLTMWFARMIGACDMLMHLSNLHLLCWYAASDRFKVPYDYLSARIKKPPDGIITGGLIFLLMIMINCIMFINGLYFIWVFRAAARRERKISSSSSNVGSLPSFGSSFRTTARRTREIYHCLSNIVLPSSLMQAFSSTSPINSVSFDSDGLTIVLDNSATCHICNNKSLFISPITPIPTSNDIGVDTAGGTVRPIGIGNIRIKWTDDDGLAHQEVIDDVLYFPKSPVNIIGVTKLGMQRNDPEGTHILTKSQYSVFTWNFGAYTRTIHHHASGLPELPINQGTSTFKSFFTSFYTALPLTKNVRSCLMTEQNPLSSRKHDSSFLSTSCSPGTIIIGDDITFTESGSTKEGVIDDVVFDEVMTPIYKVKLSDGTLIQTRRDALKLRHEPDIGIIPKTSTQLALDAQYINRDDLDTILCPQVLSPDEEEFMHWHHRLFHLPAKQMMRLSKHGVIPRKFSKMKRIPKCASCAFGQAHRRQWRTKSKAGSSIRSDSESKPGDGVSTDQLVSAQPGLIPQISGTLTSDRITGATVFVDHVARYIYVHLMRDLTSDATLEAKAACEKVFSDFGHKIHHYRADNGRYADKDFMEDVARCNQRISFCGVGAHHQNAIAERGIKELTLVARTLLLHANRLWPEHVSTILWPLALKAAADRLNRLSVTDSMDTPISIMSGTSTAIIPSDHHTWGCPVYVLDAGLQSSTIGPPKWDPRARLGVYVGRSPIHAGSVALVLNPKTGHISPQYHVTFDDDFTTVPYLRSGNTPSNWETLVQTASEKVTSESYDLAQTWALEPVQAIPQDVILNSEGANDQDTTPRRTNISRRGRNISSDTNASTSIGQRGSSHMPPMVNLETSGLRRSDRSRTPTRRFGFFSKFCLLTMSALSMHRSLRPTSFVSRVMNQLEKVNLNFDGTSNVTHPFAFSTTASDNETYTLKEMLNQPDVPNFVQAMIEEVDAHEKNGHWEVVPRSQIGNNKPILAVWSFKRKRYPDGTINKWKARLCAHGGMQQWGVNYWETYAPVVNWISVRTLLAISVMNDLPTTAIDFVLAFPQATLSPEEKIFMEIPYGMTLPLGDRKGYVLRLRKNLYGLKQAGLNWFQYIKEGLEERGFTQSQVDPCVFFRHDAIMILYVDDCVVMSKDPRTVDNIVTSLATGQDPDNPKKQFKNQYTLTNDGGIQNYLGVEVVKDKKSNSIELKQKFLIERIIQAVGLDKELSSASKPSPVIKPLLHKDLDGLPRKYEWNYRSLVGMIGYLQGSTRPDISMATHQCARFNNDPKLSHERSIRRIAKYLLGTQNRGIVFKPDLNKGVECYVDADFSGNWNAVDSEDPQNVLSRTGFIIYYGGCPIHWVSKLQTEIALSTTEAEYVALSQAMRDVIPLMNLLEEFSKIVPIANVPPQIKCKVFEDNTSCITVAKAPSMTPRTKHIALKYHFFRAHVKSGLISINYVKTTEQLADILTKPLSGELFEYLRNRIMGW